MRNVEGHEQGMRVDQPGSMPIGRALQRRPAGGFGGLLCVGVVAVACAAWGDIRYVALPGRGIAPYTNWLDAATNIQSAVNVAGDGDTVLVSNGTYNVVSQIVVTQAVSVLAVSGPDYTVVDAAQNCRCFYLRHTNAAVEGFTIQGGSVTNTGGGGVLIDGGGTVRACVIIENSAGIQYSGASGGGVAAFHNGQIVNCTVLRNTATEMGGGIIVGPGVLVSNCRIEDNQAYNGGGVFCGDGGRVENSVIVLNRAEYGGGFCAYGDGVLVSSLVTSNSAMLGGGLLIQGGTAVGCRIDKNRAYAGGGVFTYEGSWVQPGPTWGVCTSLVQNCFISGNRADRGGGVLVNEGGHLMTCTIAGNSAGEGGGIYCDQRGNIVNTIVWSNAATNGEDILNIDTNMTYSFCNAPIFLPGDGNITNAPLLTQAYRLKSTSPCIDAGTASNSPLTDIDGETRWDHPGHSNVVSVVDIGADEFVDTDFDNMADSWETQEFGGLTNRDGTADSDGDALNDLAEYDNATAPTNSDSDADQMPDGWEVGFGLNPLSDDSAQDGDSDGAANLAEYTADTNPTNALSVLSFLSAQPEASGMRLDWKGGQLAWQFLECRESLTDTNEDWHPILGLPPPTPVTNAVIDLGATNRTLFYRIRAER